jgi:hypothetical protein
LAWCTVVIVALPGCANKSDRSAVSGNVTLDGQPIKAGVIRFIPADGQTPTADAAIADGKFSGSVPPGDKKISISAPKVTGQRRVYETPDSPKVDVVEELVPARYNARSELTWTITAEAQQKDFDLKSGE